MGLFHFFNAPESPYLNKFQLITIARSKISDKFSAKKKLHFYLFILAVWHHVTSDLSWPITFDFTSYSLPGLA